MDLPCQWWPSEGSFGALAYFPEEVAVAPWGLELLWPPLACVSKSAFGPGSKATAGPKSERKEEASKGRAICGRGGHRVWLLAGVALQVR